MPRVIIQPAGSGAQKHFRSTIETPVPIARIRPFVTADKFQQLTQIYGAEGSAPMWGVRPYGERDWSQFQSGDIVAFIGFNRIYKTMRVTTTLRSEDLARNLWGLHDRGDSWEFMFCLNDGRNQRISSQDYCKLMGHRPNYHPVRMTLLTQSRSDQLIPLLNLDDRSQEYREPVRQTSEADSDGPSLSNARRQQSLLRDLLQVTGKAIYNAMRQKFK